MRRKTINDVRAELRHSQERCQKITLRAEAAEKEVIKQRARAEAYEGAVMALIADMKRLGFEPARKST